MVRFWVSLPAATDFRPDLADFGTETAFRERRTIAENGATDAGARARNFADSARSAKSFRDALSRFINHLLTAPASGLSPRPSTPWPVSSNLSVVQLYCSKFSPSLRGSSWMCHDILCTASKEWLYTILAHSRTASPKYSFNLRPPSCIDLRLASLRMTMFTCTIIAACFDFLTDHGHLTGGAQMVGQGVEWPGKH